MTRLPVLSVVIPTYQEVAYIDRCLDSLLAGSWPVSRLEVLVADGGSTDGTRERIAARAAESGIIRLIDNPDRYVPQALNRGIEASQGEVVAIMGAHAEADPEWLTHAWDSLQAHPEVAGVGGRWEIAAETDLGRALALAQSSPVGVGRNSYRNGAEAGYADTIVYGAYRRSIFQRHGLFDEEMVRDQDDEFNIRLLAAGERLWFDPRICFTYHARDDYRRLWRQYYQYGFWKVRVRQKAGRLGSLRQLAPMAFVAGGTATLLSLPLGELSAMGAAAYWGLYFGALSVGAMVSAPRRPALWPRFVGAAAVMHAAYGTGFWEGLMRFGVLRTGPRAAHTGANR